MPAPVVTITSAPFPPTLRGGVAITPFFCVCTALYFAPSPGVITWALSGITGLAINASSGQVTGAPAVGAYTAVVTATAANGGVVGTASMNINVLVNTPPVLTGFIANYNIVANFQTLDAFSVSAAATVTLDALAPAWASIRISTSTAFTLVLYPPPGTAGVFAFNLQVSTEDGDAVIPVTATCVDEFSSPNTFTFIANTAFLFRIQTNFAQDAGVAPTFADLPAGLNPATRGDSIPGAIPNARQEMSSNGMPAVGTYVFTVTVASAVSGVPFVSQEITINIIPQAPVILSTAGAITNDQAVNIQLLANSPVTAWGNAGLPAGLALSAAGLLAGILDVGVYVFGVTATNAYGVGTANYTLTVTQKLNAASVPWLPWLHTDPTLIDLQLDIRTGAITSYYGPLVLNCARDLRFAVVLWDRGVTIPAVNDLRFAALKTDEFNSGLLIDVRNVEPIDTGSGTYFLLQVPDLGMLPDDPIAALFAKANAPAGPDSGSASLAALGELVVETSLGLDLRAQIAISIVQNVVN